MRQFIEGAQIVAGFVPLDLKTQRDADWVKTANFNRLNIVFFKGTVDGGAAPTITIQQATDNQGGGAKALDFTEIWRKQATDIQTVGQFTKTTQASANTYTNEDANQQAIWVLEINHRTLDSGFTHT